MICFLVVDPIITFTDLFVTLRFHCWVDESLVEYRYSHKEEYEHRTECKRSFLVPDFQHVYYLVSIGNTPNISKHNLRNCGEIS